MKIVSRRVRRAVPASAKYQQADPHTIDEQLTAQRLNPGNLNRERIYSGKGTHPAVAMEHLDCAESVTRRRGQMAQDGAAFVAARGGLSGQTTDGVPQYARMAPASARVSLGA